MKKTWVFVILFFVFGFSNFAQKDKTHLLLRKWLMTEMQVEGQKYSEEMLERQRSKGIVTILQFTKGSTCYLYIKSPKGKTTKKNKWKFNEEQTQLIIQPEEENTAQVFSIEKISSKKLILSILDNGVKQVFSYKALKD